MSGISFMGGSKGGEGVGRESETPCPRKLQVAKGFLRNSGVVVGTPLEEELKPNGSIAS